MNSPTYWQRVEELFLAALERAPGERAQFLAATCGVDEALRAEVVSLLTAHEGETALLDWPAPRLAAQILAATEPGALGGQAIRQYRFLKLLGVGGMGEVWLAQDEKLRRQVAIKALAVNPLSATRGQSRLFNEAQAAARLDHPNVCTVYEILEAEAHCFIVMQYIEGETLAERLKRGRLRWREAVEIAAQIADALAEAHAAGIIHRDIKPQNVLLNTRGVVKVLDFGIAELRGREGERERQGDGETERRRETDSQLVSSPRPVAPPRTKPGLILGTPGYLSPEQAQGAAVDVRSDLFSLGVVLFEMLTGVAPFAGESASAALAKTLQTEAPPLGAYLPEAPVELAKLVQRALAKPPDERYQTAAELLADLRRLPQRQRATPPKLARFALRRGQSVAAALLLALLAATLFLLPRGQTSSAALTPASPAAPAAAEAYQKGLAALNYESAGLGIRKEAVEHFSRVVELEPNFAPAYANLAYAYVSLRDHEVPRAERIPKAKAAALQALALDDSLAHAHFALAEILFEDEWRFAAAEREYQRALAYNPNHAEYYNRYATKLAELGRAAEALEAMQRAAELAPYSEHRDEHLATVLFFTRHYDQLITQAQQMLAKYGPRANPEALLLQAYLGKGQYEQALAAAQKSKTLPVTFALLYALTGRRREALQIADRIQPTAGSGHQFALARIYAALGDADTAFAWLEKAYAEHEVLLVTLKIDLAFERIRSDPRFAELLRRVGLPH